MEGLQLLTTLNSDFEAELIKQKLAEAGIESLIQSGDADNMFPSVDSASGVGVFVEPYDLEKATWLITNAKDDLTDDMEVGAGG
jgi:hypothetical protein